MYLLEGRLRGLSLPQTRHPRLAPAYCPGRTDTTNMKLAITGKGGVGKTTLSALLAHSLHASGKEVLTLDADPDSNLLACMGYPEPSSVKPLVDLKDLIEERTGVKPGSTGGMFKINPTVDDIPGKYAVDVNGIKVLVAGAVKKGGSGCYCPENALVRALVSHLLLARNTTLILDMEAGVEHLGRGTVKAVDRLLIVVEPGMRSLETAVRIAALAADIGIDRINAVGNRIRSENDKDVLMRNLNGIEFTGFVPYDESIRDVEVARKPVTESNGPAMAAISDIAHTILTEDIDKQQGA